MFDAKKVKDACVQWIRDWFEENGPGCNAVLGISGGKDSSVCAALCVEALGKERVIGVTMPNGVQPDIADSIKLINHLGIKRYDINIGAAFDALMGEVEAKLGESASSQTRINMAPRLRMTAVYAVSQSNNGATAPAGETPPETFLPLAGSQFRRWLKLEKFLDFPLTLW